LNPNPTFEKKMSAVGSVADTSRDGDATDWRLQQHWMLQLFFIRLTVYCDSARRHYHVYTSFVGNATVFVPW